jgi:uncharacterized protein (TIGR02452 family)
MSKRSTRALIAQETVAILSRGWYKAPDGRTVAVAQDAARARDRSRHYTPGDFGALFRRRDAVLGASGERTPTTFRVVNSTTLAACRQLLAEGFEDVACLNFASAKNPGGGFLNGSQAQEESLARASGLYPCIAPMRAMYDANRQSPSCLYSDHMIYSPRVPVFRDDEDALLDEPYPISIITSPAVNVGALAKHETPLIASTMLTRIEKVLSVAVAHEHTALVLGAWGCGVFRNDPNDVARWFRHHLCDSPAFRNAFRIVVFAVYDLTADQHALRPFAEAFPGEDTASLLSDIS